jgi:peptide deformylase
MLLPIETGEKNPVLRKVSQEITEFKPLKKLERHMKETMKKRNGIGLAAPQVGKNIQMLLAEDDTGKILTVCNPKILFQSRETIIDEEGCLSVPDVWGMVERPQEIELEFMDITGKKQRKKFSGFFARILLHEIDHLFGVLFIDKMEK